MSQMVQPGLHVLQRSEPVSRQLAAGQRQLSSLADMLKVAAILIAAIACRYYLTNELHSPADGASEASLDVDQLEPATSPDLMDLSAVSL